jgi:flagellar motility protein MotE (MotC chaperone)
MKPVPRLLPLIAVAIGGVLAINALSGIRGLPQLLAAAQARAEEAAAPSKHSPMPATDSAPAPKPTSAPIAPACAQSPADLAKAAGLSPGELQTLQNLGARRGQLDDRERILDTQLQLLAAAEAKVDGKIKALANMKTEIKALLGQADQQQQAEVDRLTSVYQKMKPKDAAAVMATLDDKVRIPVAAKMKDAALAAILAQMPTIEAKKLTESLAHRYTAVQSLSQLDATPTAPEAATAAQTPDAKPVTADAKPAGGLVKDSKSVDAKTADTGDAAKPPVKIHMAVRKPPAHHRARAKPKTDTPTLAAAKSAIGPSAKAAPSSSAVQTAAAAGPKPALGAPASKSTTSTPPAVKVAAPPAALTSGA